MGRSSEWVGRRYTTDKQLKIYFRDICNTRQLVTWILRWRVTVGCQMRKTPCWMVWRDVERYFSSSEKVYYLPLMKLSTLASIQNSISRDVAEPSNTKLYLLSFPEINWYVATNKSLVIWIRLWQAVNLQSKMAYWSQLPVDKSSRMSICWRSQLKAHRSHQPWVFMSAGVQILGLQHSLQ